MINRACARVIATLKRFGLLKNPRLCTRSEPSCDSLERTWWGKHDCFINKML